jgi:hypothetical protein
MNPHTQVLKQAARIMREGGWVAGDRGPITMSNKPHCALGAIDCACAADYRPAQKAADFFGEYLRTHVLNEPELRIEDTYNGRTGIWAVDRHTPPNSIVAAWSNTEAPKIAKRIRQTPQEVVARWLGKAARARG